MRFLSRKSKSKVVPYGRRIDGLLQSVTVSANTVTDYRIRMNDPSDPHKTKNAKIRHDKFVDR